MNAEEARALSAQNKDYRLNKAIEDAEHRIQEATGKGEFVVLINMNKYSDDVMGYLKSKGFKVEYQTYTYGTEEINTKVMRLEVQW